MLNTTIYTEEFIFDKRQINIEKRLECKVIDTSIEQSQAGKCYLWHTQCKISNVSIKEAHKGAS